MHEAVVFNVNTSPVNWGCWNLCLSWI